ncbi:MFS superfamily transporter [Thecamonas trahens ATCC 50062]|uniref:MFS superfamily transporter n=1 Tax=Thecamonas trahens ATCC 50062 TaxID=461836 RepID=A0A0L0DI87_THETB|nr:MFS superfamily transporter [Thecamonas trahens ATCC 50062]KNC51028.1 MFS superfamily transporter [Thecamonas trahens ATCC 50062]|eukprot:XP_013756495.1 MFS superfamily transporter [Thecamonas trahens ATCC 50062]
MRGVSVGRTSLAVVYAVQFLDALGFALLMPILPFYLKTLDGYSYQYRGLWYGGVTGAYSFGQLLGSGVLGVLSDRMGRKPVLVCGLLGGAGLMVYTAFAPSVIHLLAARFLAGLSAGTGGVCGAYISDVTAKDVRSKYMGLLGAMVGLGLIAGPGLGGLVASLAGVRTAFRYLALGSSGMLFVTALGSVRLFNEPPDEAVGSAASVASVASLQRTLAINSASAVAGAEGEPLLPVASKSRAGAGRRVRITPALFAKLMRSRSVLLLCISSFMYACLFVAFEIATPLYLIATFDISAGHVGLLFTVVGVVLIIVQAGFFSRIMRGVGGPRRLVVGALLCLSVPVSVALPFQPTLLTFALLTVLLIIGQALVVPSLAVMASVLSEGANGTVLGVRRSFVSAARAIGPLAVGALYDTSATAILPHAIRHHHHILPYWVGAVCGLFSAACAFGISRAAVSLAADPAPDDEDAARDGSESD